VEYVCPSDRWFVWPCELYVTPTPIWACLKMDLLTCVISISILLNCFSTLSYSVPVCLGRHLFPVDQSVKQLTIFLISCRSLIILIVKIVNCVFEYSCWHQWLDFSERCKFFISFCDGFLLNSSQERGVLEVTPTGNGWWMTRQCEESGLLRIQ
jgi:hypothetical protein